MSKIDITTTQKVTIEYELAPLNARIFAYFIDVMIVYGSIMVLSLFLSTTSSSFFNQIILYVVILPIIIFYHLVSEIFGNGQSWGKKALGIRVVNLTGSEPSINDYLIRWIFRMIDIAFSIGTIACLLIGSSQKRQRLGDLLANTAVVRTRSETSLKLQDILKINSRENYEVTYTGVRQFNEQDMLMIKNVISRVQRYPNDAHRALLREVVDKMMERLDISKRPKEPIQFLKTLIRDYIVLTR